MDKQRVATGGGANGDAGDDEVDLDADDAATSDARAAPIPVDAPSAPSRRPNSNVGGLTFTDPFVGRGAGKALSRKVRVFRGEGYTRDGGAARDDVENIAGDVDEDDEGRDGDDAAADAGGEADAGPEKEPKAPRSPAGQTVFENSVTRHVPLFLKNQKKKFGKSSDRASAGRYKKRQHSGGLGAATTTALVEHAELICLLAAGGIKASQMAAQVVQHQRELAAMGTLNASYQRGGRRLATALGTSHVGQPHPGVIGSWASAGWVADGALIGALGLNVILRRVNQRLASNVVSVRVSPGSVEKSAASHAEAARAKVATTETLQESVEKANAAKEAARAAAATSAALTMEAEKMEVESEKAGREWEQAVDSANARATAAEKAADVARERVAAAERRMAMAEKRSLEAAAAMRSLAEKEETKVNGTGVEAAEEKKKTDGRSVYAPLPANFWDAPAAAAATPFLATYLAPPPADSTEASSAPPLTTTESTVAEEKAASKESAAAESPKTASSREPDLGDVISRVRSRATSLKRNLAASRAEARAAAEAAISAAAGVPIRSGGTRISHGTKWDVEDDVFASQAPLRLEHGDGTGPSVWEREAMDRAVKIEAEALERAERASREAEEAKAEAESAARAREIEVAAANARAAAAEEMAELARKRAAAAEERSLESAARFSEEADRCVSSVRYLAMQSNRFMKQDPGFGFSVFSEGLHVGDNGEWQSVEEEYSFRRTTTKGGGGGGVGGGEGGGMDEGVDEMMPPPPQHHHQLGPPPQRQSVDSLRASEKTRDENGRGPSATLRQQNDDEDTWFPEETSEDEDGELVATVGIGNVLTRRAVARRTDGGGGGDAAFEDVRWSALSASGTTIGRSGMTAKGMPMPYEGEGLCVDVDCNFEDEFDGSSGWEQCR